MARGKSKFKFEQESYKFLNPKNGKTETAVIFYQTIDGTRTNRIYCDKNGIDALKHLATAKGYVGPKNGGNRYIHPQDQHIQIDLPDGKVYLTHMFDLKTAEKREPQVLAVHA